MSLLRILPVVNASLNALSGLLLVAAWVMIRRRRIAQHKALMLSACATSIVFLCSYLFYHWLGGMTHFAGTGWSRPVYFSILVSHTILAVTIVPLAILSVMRGLRMQVAKHRRIARWTLPIWLYVSITGVLVYMFLYQWYPSRSAL